MPPWTNANLAVKNITEEKDSRESFALYTKCWAKLMCYNSAGSICI